MLYVLVFPFLSICLFTAYAGVDYESEGSKFAKEQIREIKKLDLEKVLEEKDKLKKPKEQASEGETVDEKSCKNCHVNLENPMSGLESEENSVGAKKEHNRDLGKDSILVFVSFSMPNIAINELNDVSEKYGAKLILRGLHEQSFQKTAKKILEINKDGLKLDINPELFKKYEIKKVPTFIFIKKGKEVSRLSGNVSLEYAKSKLVEE